LKTAFATRIIVSTEINTLWQSISTSLVLWQDQKLAPSFYAMANFAAAGVLAGFAI